jgi:ribose/xylose/arabinose/galactoside ABC-type transport system permease subunit
MSRARDIWYRHRIEFAVLGVFFALIAVFAIANPRVFLNYRAYMAVFTTLGASIILVTSNVFIVASGEMDLSFPSVIGLGAMVFAMIARTGASPVLGLLAALATGALCGLLNGILVTQVGLSSLVSTLGMNFLLRGLIMIITGGLAIPLTFLLDTLIWKVFAGTIGVFPVQLIWGLGFAFLGWLLFTRHKFGGHVCYTGDNLTSAREMGIQVDRVKTWTFILMGFSAGLVGVLVTLLNSTFWPTTGSVPGRDPDVGGDRHHLGRRHRGVHPRVHRNRDRRGWPDGVLHPVLLRGDPDPRPDQPPVRGPEEEIGGVEASLERRGGRWHPMRRRATSST